MKAPVLLLIIASAVSLGGCSRDVAADARSSPLSTACQVALAAGSQTSTLDRTIAGLQAEARQPARTRQALEQLGYQFVAKARITNDPGAYRLAESAATCLDEHHPGDASALLLRGHALHQLHRFQEAEAIARTLVTKRQFVLDYALLGDALMEQGHLAEAADAYQKMIDLKPFYQSYTRAAHLRWLKGDLDGAEELMQKAVASASPRNPESVAWAYTRLAFYELQRGHLDEATRATDRALSFQADYAAALLIRGRILLATGRPIDAVESLRRAATLNPLPEYQWTLADALRRSGRDHEAIVIEDDLTAHGPATDPRTVALFLATRRHTDPQALVLADRELTVRRDVFTEDARAWALAAAGRATDAHAVMERALAEHTRDARLFLHAGVIATATNRRADARRWFTQADSLRSTLLPSELDILRRYYPASTSNHAGE
jgi:tetratricopeptide (TPR) repeat protein